MFKNISNNTRSFTLFGFAVLLALFLCAAGMVMYGCAPSADTSAKDEASNVEVVEAFKDLANDPYTEVLYMTDITENEMKNDGGYSVDLTAATVIYYDKLDNHCYRLRMEQLLGYRKGGLATSEHMLTKEDGVTPMTKDEVLAKLDKYDSMIAGD